jgi:hypothetical protein
MATSIYPKSAADGENISGITWNTAQNGTGTDVSFSTINAAGSGFASGYSLILDDTYLSNIRINQNLTCYYLIAGNAANCFYVDASSAANTTINCDTIQQEADTFTIILEDGTSTINAINVVSYDPVMGYNAIGIYTIGGTHTINCDNIIPSYYAPALSVQGGTINIYGTCYVGVTYLGIVAGTPCNFYGDILLMNDAAGNFINWGASATNYIQVRNLSKSYIPIYFGDAAEVLGGARAGGVSGTLELINLY